MKKHLKDIFYITLFIVLCLGFFYPTFVSGKLPVPTDTLIGLYHPWRDLYGDTNPRGVPYKNFLITDPIRQEIPWKKLAISELKAGHFISWNPYNFSGTPLSANIQAGLLYPLNILFLVLPFIPAWTVLIILQPILAGIFLYVYLRSKKLIRPASLVASIAWAFSGFFISWLTWGTIDHTALWIPLILLSSDRILESTPRAVWRWTLLFVVAIVSMVFAGHIQVAGYGLGLVLLYEIFSLRYAVHARRGWWLLAGLAAAGLVISLQVVPLLSLLSHSGRVTDATAWLADGWFLPWQHLVQFLVPDFFGNPATLNYWGVWNYGELTGYIGILPFIFAVYALVVRRDRLTAFYAILSGLILLFLLPTPLSKIPYQLRIPILSSLQPTRLMVLLDFGFVVLSALGLDYFIRTVSKKILWSISLVIICLMAAWLTAIIGIATSHDPLVIANLAVAKKNLILPTFILLGSVGISALFFLPKVKRELVLLLVVGLVTFDMFRFGWKFTPFTPVEYFFPTTNTISFLQKEPDAYRVMSMDKEVLPPNTASYFGIESPEGYDPVYDATYEQFIAAVNRGKPDIQPPYGFNRILTITSLDSSLFPLLNTKYILSLTPLTGRDLQLVFVEGKTHVYEYKKVLPRMFAVSKVVSAVSPQQAIDTLYQKGFNVRQQAVSTAPYIKEVTVTSRDTVKITSRTPRSLTAVTSLEADHLVVILMTYDAGWSATIDGKDTPIYRTDMAFSGILVPKGTHHIALTYK